LRVRSRRLYKIQQFLSHAWQLHHSAICHSNHLFDKHLSASIKANSQKWSSIWLTTLPTRPDVRVSNPVYRFAVCLRLGVPPVNLIPDWKSNLNLLCESCNVSLIDVPFHRIHCVHESALGRRVQHNIVNKTFATFARLCGHAVETEPDCFAEPLTRKRPDGFIRLNDGGNMIYDVRGFDSLAPSYID
jgi:hypothetical protein